MQSTDTGSKRPEVSLTTQVRRQCTAGVTLVLGVIWLLGCFLLLLPIALIKLALPHQAVRGWCAGRMDRIVGLFSAGLQRLLALMRVGAYELRIHGDLRTDRTYLLVCNHQSWVDILYLLVLHHRRIPFPRFFLKRELIWFPVIGFACWAMDFPFMRRYSSQAKAANPALAQRDLETARAACARYRGRAVTIINYVEGTRFSRARHAAQEARWTHLLNPRAGGGSYVIDAMGDQLDGIIDTTLAYPTPEGPGFWRFLTGTEQPVLVEMALRPVPSFDHSTPRGRREQARNWVNALWDEKDLRIEAMRAELEPRLR